MDTKEKLAALEKEILEAILKFECQTGCMVHLDKIGFYRTGVSDSPAQRLQDIRIPISLK